MPEGSGEAATIPAIPETLAFAVVWCADEPARLGELLTLPGLSGDTPRVFGRGLARADDPHPRLHLVRDRPRGPTPAPPLRIDRISRVQLVLNGREDNVEVRNVGRCSLLVNGEQVSDASVGAGDILQLGAQLMFLCVRRPAWLPEAGGFVEMPFGEPDAHGFVGESAPMWALRRNLMFVAPKRQHVLVLGESGTGKELAARALHALSPRAGRPFISRNAATLPEGLLDAELFGNTKNYPNPGMPDRPGLIGQAHDGTLFLDEFAELPTTSQVHLLRVLDGGEYQRLGEATARHSDFRLVAATNRDPSALKQDLLARVPLRVRVPDLNERREDIPLLARHFLRRIATENADVARRVLPGRDPKEEPMIPADVARELVLHPYTTHVRELGALIWNWLSGDGTPRTYSASPENATSSRVGSGTHATVRASVAPPSFTVKGSSGDDANAPSAEEIRACLERHNGIIDQAWRALGLRNRHALARLITKHNIVVTRRPDARRRRRTRP
jgi:DNA-binding NtrC family response regulator